MRKTKIVCTVGPATDSIDVLRDLMKSGMNVAHRHHAGHQGAGGATGKVRER